MNVTCCKNPVIFLAMFKGKLSAQLLNQKVQKTEAGHPMLTSHISQLTR